MGTIKGITKQELVLTVKTLRATGHSIRQIAAQLKKSTTTIQSYLHKDFGESCWKRSRSSVLDPFKTEIETMINESQRWRKQAMNRKTAHRRFCERHPGIKIGYEAFNNFVKDKCVIRAERGLASIPLAHSYGEAQIDFHDETYILNGKRVNGHGFTMSFPASNARFALLYPSENQQCLAEAIVTCIHHIGFVPHTIVFDNASTAVATIMEGHDRVMTKKYERLAAHYGFTPVFCNPCRGNEKGNVEVNNRIIRQKFFSDPPRITSLEAFNKQLLDKCSEEMKTRKHHRYGSIIEDLFKQDIENGLPMPKTKFDCRDMLVRTTDKCALIHVDRVQYSTSDKHRERKVRVLLGATTLEVYDEYGNHICSHKRHYDPGLRVIDKEAYKDALKMRPAAHIADGAQEYLQGIRPREKAKMLQEIAEAEGLAVMPISDSLSTALFNLRAYNIDWRKYEGLIPEHHKLLQETAPRRSIC